MSSAQATASPEAQHKLREAQGKIGVSLKNAQYAITANGPRALSSSLGETTNAVAALSAYLALNGNALKAAAIAGQTAKVLKAITAHAASREKGGHPRGSTADSLGGGSHSATPLGSSYFDDAAPRPPAGATHVAELSTHSAMGGGDRSPVLSSSDPTPITPGGPPVAEDETKATLRTLRAELEDVKRQRDQLERDVAAQRREMERQLRSPAEGAAAAPTSDTAPLEDGTSASASASGRRREGMPGALTRDIDDLRTRLREEHHRFNEANDALHEAQELAKSQETHIKALTQDMRSLQAAVDANDQLIKRKDEELQSLQESYVAQAAALQAMKSGGSASAAQQPQPVRAAPHGYVDKDDFDALKLQNQLLQQALREQGTRGKVEGGATLSNQTLHELESDHQQQLAALKMTIQEGYDRENDLQEQNTALKDTIKEFQMKLDSLGNRQWIQEEREKHQEEVKALKAQLCSREEELADAREQNTQLIQKMTAAAQDFNESLAKEQEANNEERAALTERIAELQTRLEATESGASETQQEYLQQANTHIGTIAELKEQLAAEQQRADREQQRAEAAEGTAEEREAGAQQQAAELRAALDAARERHSDEVAQLREQLAAEQQRAEAAEGTAEEREAGAQQQAAELRAALDAARERHSDEVAQLREQLAAEQQRATDAREDCESLREQFTSERNRGEELRAVLAETKVELELQSAKNLQHERQIAAEPVEWLREENSSLQGKVQSLEADIVRLTQASDEERQKARQATQVQASLQDQISSLKAELDGQQNAIETSIKAKELLSAKVASMVTSYEAAVEDGQRKTRELNELRSIKTERDNMEKEREVLRAKCLKEKAEKEKLMAVLKEAVEDRRRRDAAAAAAINEAKSDAAGSDDASSLSARVGGKPSPPQEPTSLVRDRSSRDDETEEVQALRESNRNLQRGYVELTDALRAAGKELAEEQALRRQVQEALHKATASSPPPAPSAAPLPSPCEHQTPSFTDTLREVQANRQMLMRELGRFCKSTPVVDDDSEVLVNAATALYMSMREAGQETGRVAMRVVSAERKAAQTLQLELGMQSKLKHSLFSSPPSAAHEQMRVDLAETQRLCPSMLDMPIMQACKELFDGIVASRRTGDQQKSLKTVTIARMKPPPPLPAPSRIAPQPTGSSRADSVFVATPQDGHRRAASGNRARSQYGQPWQVMNESASTGFAGSGGRRVGGAGYGRDEDALFNSARERFTAMEEESARRHQRMAPVAPKWK